MRKRVLFNLLALFIFSNIALIFAIYNHLSQIKEKITKEIYETRLREFETYLKGEKLILSGIADYIANAPCVIDAYLHNDRNELIRCMKPLYKSLYEKHLIEELHFFKPLAVSFVNFANLKTYNVNFSKIRADILWVSNSLISSIHFYVCRFYPGLRVTRPIFYKDKLLGSLSFGVHIKHFADFFKNVVTKDVVIYLNDRSLRNFLRKDRYKEFEKYPLYKGFRVIGKVYPIKLEEGVEERNNLVFTKIRLEDFFKGTFAFLVAVDDISWELRVEYRNTLLMFFIFEIIFGVIFAVFYIIFRNIYNRFKEFENITDLIRDKKFEKLPKLEETKVTDRLDLFKFKLVKLGEELKIYINLLTKEAEYYKNRAYIDALTGVFNRNFLEEKGDEIFTKFKLQKIPVGVIMLDIDNFKRINDTYGHDVGDLVLKSLAETIKGILRKNDYIIRYGGEEFLILLPNATIDQAIKVAEKIRKEIENKKIKIGDKEIKFTVSLGVSEIYTSDRSLQNAIKRADEKLYKAKKKGKNRVEV